MRILFSILGRLRAMIGWTTFNITFTPDAAIPGQSHDVLVMCLELGYTRRDINLMYTNFKKLDVYHNNIVHFASFCAVNNIDNPLGELIFHKILEVDKHKEITFENYLVCIWNAFSVFDNSSVAELAFQVFNSDKSEISRMVALMYGDETTKYQNVMSALKSNVKDYSKDLSEYNFVQLVNKSPALFLPILELLRIGKKNTLSIARWDEIRKKLLTTTGERKLNKNVGIKMKTEDIYRTLELANMNQGRTQIIDIVKNDSGTIPNSRKGSNYQVNIPTNFTIDHYEPRNSNTSRDHNKDNLEGSIIGYRRKSSVQIDAVAKKRLSNAAEVSPEHTIVDNSMKKRVSNAADVLLERVSVDSKIKKRHSVGAGSVPSSRKGSICPVNEQPIAVGDHYEPARNSNTFRDHNNDNIDDGIRDTRRKSHGSIKIDAAMKNRLPNAAELSPERINLDSKMRGGRKLSNVDTSLESRNLVSNTQRRSSASDVTFQRMNPTKKRHSISPDVTLEQKNVDSSIRRKLSNAADISLERMSDNGKSKRRSSASGKISLERVNVDVKIKIKHSITANG